MLAGVGWDYPGGPEVPAAGGVRPGETLCWPFTRWCLTHCGCFTIRLAWRWASQVLRIMRLPVNPFQGVGVVFGGVIFRAFTIALSTYRAGRMGNMEDEDDAAMRNFNAVTTQVLIIAREGTM